MRVLTITVSHPFGLTSRSSGGCSSGLETKDDSLKLLEILMPGALAGLVPGSLPPAKLYDDSVALETFPDVQLCPSFMFLKGRF